MGKNKNAYAEVIQAKIDYYRRTEKQLQIQYMIDMFSIVLNDPDVMGRDVLGKQRLERVILAVSKMYDEYYEALQPRESPEADYYQDKLDERLQKIFQEKFEPFSERYNFLVRTTY